LNRLRKGIWVDQSATPAKPIPKDLLLEVLAVVVAFALVAVEVTLGVIMLVGWGTVWAAGKELEAQLITQLNSNPNTAKRLGRVKRLILLI
jgi:hypothetical protein